jgi:hypothetical protein
MPPVSILCRREFGLRQLRRLFGQLLRFRRTIRGEARAPMRENHCKAQEIEQGDKPKKINCSAVLFEDPV